MKSDAKLKIRRFLEQANWHISGRIVVGVGEGASDDLFSLCSKGRYKQATNIRLTLPGETTSSVQFHQRPERERQ